MVGTQEDAVNIIVPTMLATFEHNFRAGYYFMTPIDPESARKDVEQLLSQLPHYKHKQVETIREYYGFTEKGEPKTVQTIANERKQSKQSISALISSGLRNLREVSLVQELAIKYSSLGHKAELEKQIREEVDKGITGLIKKTDDYISGAASRESGLSPESQAMLNESIGNVMKYFPTRVHYSLERNNITTVAELVRLTPKMLMKKSGFGKVNVKLVDDTLRKHGLYLGMAV